MSQHQAGLEEIGDALTAERQYRDRPGDPPDAL